MTWLQDGITATGPTAEALILAGVAGERSDAGTTALLSDQFHRWATEQLEPFGEHDEAIWPIIDRAADEALMLGIAVGLRLRWSTHGRLP